MAVVAGYPAVHGRFRGPHRYKAAVAYLEGVSELMNTRGFLVEQLPTDGGWAELLPGMVSARHGVTADAKSSGRHANAVPDAVLQFETLLLANGRDKLQVSQCRHWVASAHWTFNQGLHHTQ